MNITSQFILLFGKIEKETKKTNNTLWIGRHWAHIKLYNHDFWFFSATGILFIDH